MKAAQALTLGAPSTPATTQVPTLTVMPPNPPGRVRVGIYLTPEAHRTLKEYCRIKQVSLTAWLEGVAAHVAVRIDSGDIDHEYPLEQLSLAAARDITKQRLSRKPRGDQTAD